MADVDKVGEIPHQETEEVFSSEELSNIAQDLQALRNYDLYHPSDANRDENPYSAIRSPFLLEKLRDDDWLNIVAEFEQMPPGTEDIEMIAQRLTADLMSGDPSSSLTFFRLARTTLAVNGSPSPATVPNVSLYSRSEAQKIIHLVAEGSVPIDAAKGDLEAIFYSSENTAEAKKESPENRHARIKANLSSEIQQEVTKLLEDLNPRPVEEFPYFVSDRLAAIANEAELANNRFEVIEELKEDLVSEYQQGRHREQVLETLAILDPDLALAEASMNPGDRDIILGAIAVKDSSLILDLYDQEMITKDELRSAIDLMSVANPNYLLTHAESIDLSYGELNNLKVNALRNSDPVHFLYHYEAFPELAVFEEVQMIANDKREQVLDRLSYFSPEDRLVALSKISYYSAGFDQNLAHLFESTLADEALQLRATLSVSCDIDSPDLFADYDRRSELREFIKIRDRLTAGYPEELRFVLNLSALTSPNQSLELRGVIAEDVLSLTSNYGDRRALSPMMIQALNTNLITNWGVEANSLSIMDWLNTYESFSVDQQLLVKEYLKDQINGINEGSVDIFENFDITNVVLTYSPASWVKSDSELMQLYTNLILENKEFFNEAVGDIRFANEVLPLLVKADEVFDVVIAQQDIEDVISYLNSFSRLVSEEQLASIFEQIKQVHPILAPVSSLEVLNSSRATIGYYPFEGEAINAVMDLYGALSTEEVEILKEAHYGNIASYEIGMAHLLLAKHLQSTGVSPKDSFFWSTCLCQRYGNADFLSSLTAEELARYESITRIVRHNRLSMAEFMISRPDVDWEEGSPHLVDQVIGNKPEVIDEFLTELSLQLDLSVQQELNLRNLFLLKDLRQGKMARRVVVCGLIALSGTEEERAAIANLLDGESVSKDDPKRLRSLFRARRYVDIVAAIHESEPGIKSARDRVVGLVSDKFLHEFGYTQAEIESRSLNIENLIAGGVLSRYVALSRRYDRLNQERTVTALHDTFKSITAGNFPQWRLEHPESVLQLSVVSEEAAKAWVSALPIIEATIQPTSIGDLERTVKNITKDLEGHLHGYLRNIDTYLAHAQNQYQANPDNYHMQKLDEMQQKMKVKQAIQTIKEYDFTSQSIDGVLPMCYDLWETLTRVNAGQAAHDAEQLIKAIDEETVSKPEKAKAGETDEYMQLIDSGIYPRETCQSWRNGMYNECLVSTVADANKRVAFVQDGEGNERGRALIKLVPLTIGEEVVPVVLHEPVYTLKSNNSIDVALAAVAANKSIACELPLAMRDMSSPVEKYLESLGCTFEYVSASLAAIHPTGEYEYSDTFGGRLNAKSKLSLAETQIVLVHFP